ncbi:MAG: cation diffusion facilitator family transporter [Pseudomonadota bacterium]
MHQRTAKTVFGADKERDRQVQYVILIEGFANLAVLILKVIVGFSTGSLAILADAAHSLSDLANNIVVWFVIRLSAEPPDQRHPYGHRKFETVAVFGLAVLLFVIAIEVVLRAFERGTPEVLQSGSGLLLLIIGLAINIAITVWESAKAKELDSDILHADASHTFSDVLTTLLVIVGWQLSVVGYAWVDTMAAFAVAILIAYLAFGLLKKVLPVLVDEYAIEPGTLIESAKQVPGVQSVKVARSRWLGSGIAVDMVLTVDPSISAAEAHDISEAVESSLNEQYRVEDISIHIEPHEETSVGGSQVG